MRIVLDRAKCQGHGRCYSLAPELFDSDDEGYSELIVQGDLPPHLEDSAVLAAENCPELAIEVERG
jgi:ferredoxin